MQKFRIVEREKRTQGGVQTETKLCKLCTGEFTEMDVLTLSYLRRRRSVRTCSASGHQGTGGSSYSIKHTEYEGINMVKEIDYLRYLAGKPTLEVPETEDVPPVSYDKASTFLVGLQYSHYSLPTASLSTDESPRLYVFHSR